MQRQKNEYYIEVYTNPYPNTSVKLYKVHRGYPDRDTLHPGYYALLGPYDASNKEEALANALWALELYKTAHHNMLLTIRNILSHHYTNSEISAKVRQVLMNLITKGI
jgi:hypothetical protein